MAELTGTDSPATDLVEALANINERAKRIPHVVGSLELPTEWDRRHQAIDELLTLILLETP